MRPTDRCRCWPSHGIVFSVETPIVPAPRPPDARLTAESGQAVVEAAIVMPAMVFLILVLLQLTMVQHARIMTDYAAYCAARAGIVYNADNTAMQQAATIALLPTLGRTDNLAAFTQTAGGVMLMRREVPYRTPFGLPIVRVTTLSPKPADFNATLTRHTGGREIDFDDVRPAAARPNQLQIEVKYFYRMKVPFANKMLQTLYFASRPRTYMLNRMSGMDVTRPEIFGRPATGLAEAAFVGSGTPDAARILAARRAAGARTGGFYMPLTATYTMRMQSNAFRANVN
jgi:hypothetical protein